MTTCEFHPEVEDAHLALDVDDGDAVYVVGDVHGCLRPLESLLEKLNVTEDDLVVFVGDLIRMAPESDTVLELVRERGNLVTARGNNEEKVIRGEASLPDLDAGAVDYLLSLSVAITLGETLVVHGGVDLRKSLAEHTVDDLQTMRSLAPTAATGRCSGTRAMRDRPASSLATPSSKCRSIGSGRSVWTPAASTAGISPRTTSGTGPSTPFQVGQDGVTRRGSKIVSVEEAPSRR